MPFRKSPAEARQLWLAALRSGEFRQCKNQLCDGEKYCCLGVACEVFRLHEPEQNMLKIEPTLTQNNDGRWKYSIGGHESGGVLPDEVKAWLGMKTPDGFLGLRGKPVENLSAANDEGQTFAQIAEIISSHTQELFGAEASH